jgi:hypothetical protein
MGLSLVEVLDGGDVNLEDREDKASSHELIITKPYQPCSWDEENYVENVYQMIPSSLSYSFFINGEYSCSSIPLINIVDTSGSHLCREITSHTMVDSNLCRSFVSTNLSQVNGYLKCESRDDF